MVKLSSVDAILSAVMDNSNFSCGFVSMVKPRLSRYFFASTLLKDSVEISVLFAKWSATATTYFGGYFFPSSDTSIYFTLVLCSGTPFSSIKFKASITSCFFSFGVAMLHLLESVYTHYIIRMELFSI